MTDSSTCPNGHFNPAENLHCGTCGAPLDSPAGDSLSDASEPPVTSPASKRTLIFVWGAVAVVALIIGGFVVASHDGEGATDSASITAADDITTTTMTIESMCKREIASWMDYVTAPGGSIMDGAAEYGIQSPSFQLLQNTWTTYQENLYQLGQDDAGAKALDVLKQGCDALGSRYEPGHIAPS